MRFDKKKAVKEISAQHEIIFVFFYALNLHFLKRVKSKKTQFTQIVQFITIKIKIQFTLSFKPRYVDLEQVNLPFMNIIAG